jgi:hypothetical protein
MCVRLVRPVHQSPTEKVPRLERLSRRLTRSLPAEQTDQPRKAPGNAQFSRARCRTPKTAKDTELDWRRGVDSNFEFLDAFVRSASLSDLRRS